MEQGPSEAGSRSAAHKIPHFLRTRKTHSLCHKIPPPAIIASQLNPTHNPRSNLLNNSYIYTVILSYPEFMFDWTTEVREVIIMTALIPCRRPCQDPHSNCWDRDHPHAHRIKPHSRLYELLITACAIQN